MRRFAIGDVHGCAKALRTVIEEIDPQPHDTLIFLGDYVDRGPNSRDVVQQIIELQARCRVIPLCGNHELVLTAILDRGADHDVWFAGGGRATITSYGGKLSKIPESHREFLRDLKPYYEDQDTICVHAGYDPTLPMQAQSGRVMHWDHLPAQLPSPHVSGKRVFFGHTPQASGNVLDAGHLVCIDTYCFGGGYLTAFEIDTNCLIQVDHHGHLRRAPGAAIAKALRHLRTHVNELFQRRAVLGDKLNLQEKMTPTLSPPVKVQESLPSDSEIRPAATK